MNKKLIFVFLAGYAISIVFPASKLIGIFRKNP